MRRVLFVLVVLMIAAGIVRASLESFDAKRQGVVTACQAERARLGIKSDAALYSKYPTPEITLVTTACIPPGGTGQLIVKGKFVPGTKFLLQSDHLEIVQEALTATEYRATIKAPEGVGPEVADFSAYTPVSCASAHGQKAAVVTGKFDFDLQSANGWRIKARPDVDTRCKPREQGSIKYTVEFFKGTETAAFQKREGELFFSPYDQNPYQLRMQEERFGEDVQAQIQALTEKMTKPGISDAEREKLMEQIEALSEKMIAQMSDRAAMQKLAAQAEQRRKEFGCEMLKLQVEAGSQVRGEMNCGQLVGRGVKLTGIVAVDKVTR
jgi:hypothetical protein